MDDRESIIDINKDASLFLRGCAILLVILGHTHVIQCGAPGVYLFLILSGFGLTRSNMRNGFSRYWRKRLLSVFFPYIIVAVLNLVTIGWSDPKQFFYTVLGLDFSQNVDATMWYISYAFFWYILLYFSSVLSDYCVRNHKWANHILKLILIVFGGVLCKRLSITRVWDWKAATWTYTWAFPLGVFFAYMKEIHISKREKSLLWIFVLFVSTAYMFRHYLDDFDQKYAFFMAIQFVSITQLLKITERKFRIICWLGRYSYPIYLFEGVLLWQWNCWFGVISYNAIKIPAYYLTTVFFAFIYWNGIIKNTESFQEKIMRL